MGEESQLSHAEKFQIIYVNPPPLGGGSPLPAPFFSLACFFRAAPTAYGESQARGQIAAAAASHSHSHSHTGSEPHLQPTPQVTATPDPRLTEQG